ncbi:methyltransferase [Sodalis-like endosymbiont of Proechinophthirus fluctus]|uniref:methyltransferase n=1 Tax=Sodalis-like endosymbiont of Proechinophthirus fluctus TaxID=1462730 RepID=UPI0034E97AC1
MLANDVYSTISGPLRYDYLQPAVPRWLQTNLKTAETLIRGALDHLHIGGKLRIVANAFLPYPYLLDAVFSKSSSAGAKQPPLRSIRLSIKCSVSVITGENAANSRLEYRTQPRAAGPVRYFFCNKCQLNHK